MANTVIGFFDTRAEAEDAVTQLTAAGISRSSIDISTGYSTNDGSTTTSAAPLDGDQKEGNAITRFFNSLFGDDTDDAKKYSDVSQYMDTIVTVHAASTQQAEDAADILDSAGAVNVDERYASSANYAASSGYSSGMDSNSSMNTAAGYAGTSGYSSDGLTANAGSTDNTGGTSSALAGTRDLDYTGSNDNRTDMGNDRNNTFSGNREADFINPSDAGTRNSLKGNTNEYSNAADTDRTNSFAGTGTDNQIRSTGTGDTDKIDRVEEELQLSKRTVQTGGVRVRSRIVERPIEENMRLREEHVRVERKPVDRPVSGTDWENFREKEIELTEHAEIPVVNKEARVVEEIRIKKDVDNREETVRDTVRSTEVDINDNQTGNRSNDDLEHHDEDYRKSQRNRDGL